VKASFFRPNAEPAAAGQPSREKLSAELHPTGAAEVTEHRRIKFFSANLGDFGVYQREFFALFGNASVTGGEKCHSGRILFQTSTVLDRNKMLPA
jgi:hypothetical protein